MVTACPVIPARNGPCRCGIHVTWCLFQGWDCIPAVGWDLGKSASAAASLTSEETRDSKASIQWLLWWSSGYDSMLPLQGWGFNPWSGNWDSNAKQYSHKKKNCNTNLHGTEPGHKCKSSIGEMPITWFLAGPLSSFCTHSWAYIHSFLHTHTLLAHWDRALYTRSLYVVHHLLSAFSALFCESVLCAVLSSSVAWLFASPWL